MSETKPKKMVSRSVAVALGIICILLVASLGGVIAYYTMAINSKDNELSTLGSEVSKLNATVNQLNATIIEENNTINSLNAQIHQLNLTLSKLLNQSEPYIHSQLLQNPPINITANTILSGWILNWTPTIDVRIIRIQVWMGNPDNVTWEGDTYVTVGEPSNLTDSSSYNDTIQLLVHYQFDSHAPSPIPHQLMFDLTPGFKVVLGQTINVWRDFVNIEPYSVTSGDVQVIIYYENA